jgi:hypothetical protein
VETAALKQRRILNTVRSVEVDFEKRLGGESECCFRLSKMKIVNFFFVKKYGRKLLIT